MELTRDALQNAESRWQSRRVASYRIEVSVSESGEPRRLVRLEVRDDEIESAAMTEDGEDRQRPVEETTALPYTVDGLFRTLEEEIAAGERRYLRASFDAALGIPERIELGPIRGAPEATRWVLRVEFFEPG